MNCFIMMKFRHLLQIFHHHGFIKKTACQLPGNTKGGSIIVPLTSCLTGLDSSVLQIKTKNCQLSYRWFQTSQTGGQWYSDTSPFSIPCYYRWCFTNVTKHYNYLQTQLHLIQTNLQSSKLLKKHMYRHKVIKNAKLIKARIKLKPFIDLDKRNNVLFALMFLKFFFSLSPKCCITLWPNLQRNSHL